MESVDQPVRFVEFVTQAVHPAPGHKSGVTLHTAGATLGGFHLLRDLVDVGMQ
jgi:hypothetical protein